MKNGGFSGGRVENYQNVLESRLSLCYPGRCLSVLEGMVSHRLLPVVVLGQKEVHDQDLSSPIAADKGAGERGDLNPFLPVHANNSHDEYTCVSC